MTFSCPNCNATLEETAKFCSQCGTPVTAPSQPTSTEVEKAVKEMERMRKELKESSPGYQKPAKIFDFEEYKGEIIDRAKKYAETAMLPLTDEGWMWMVYSSEKFTQYLQFLA